MFTQNSRRKILTLVSALGAAATMGVYTDHAAHAQCYRPQGAPAIGWKRVALPVDAPALAADRDIAQLRTGEPTWLTEPWHDQGVYLDRHHIGQTEYSFPVTPATRGSFQLFFGESLGGAKVDVWMRTNTGTLWQWKERRIDDNEIEVSWDGPRVYTIVVTVHHHLRSEPPVLRFRLVREIELLQESWLPSEFRVPRSLYYYQPAGRAVLLCDAPGQQLAVEQELLTRAGAPQPMAVQRTP
jgi:hypothetical protein